MRQNHFSRGKRGVYSIDENFWCKVVENGDIEHPERLLPRDAISDFGWNGESALVSLKFEKGLPTELDSHNLALRELCTDLNTRFVNHPFAFSYGLEGNVFGAKNPEPRMSMAGRMIHGSSDLRDIAESW